VGQAKVKRLSVKDCYLCGKPLEGPTSADHVPPKLFFPDTKGLDLLTIPTHPGCNLAYQLDEEYFVHTLLPMTRGSAAGDAQHFRIRAKMKAGKNVALVNMVMDEFKNKVGGVHLPATRVAKLIDHYRFHRVLWKVIRGLHYHHTGEILPPGWGIQYWITPPYEEPPELFRMYAESDRGVVRGKYPKVFAYFFERFKEAWGVHYWGFHLWDTVIVTAMFHDPACTCEICQFVGPTLPEHMPGTVRA
jgi:hypothetical protein